MEKPIRKSIVDEDLIETIIGLGPNLFYGASIPAALIILKKVKNPQMKNKILFVNAEKEIEEGNAQNYLRERNIEKIVNVVATYRDEPLFSRVIEKDEIVENDYNLNIVRYVQTSPPPEKIDVSEAFQELQIIKRQLDDEYINFTSLLQEMNHD